MQRLGGGRKGEGMDGVDPQDGGRLSLGQNSVRKKGNFGTRNRTRRI